MKILLSGFPGDPDVADIFVREIREEEFPFLSLDANSGSVWAVLQQNFSGFTELCEAADDWVESRKYSEPATSGAALLTRSARAKQKLLSLLDDSHFFWSASALLSGWSMADPDVAGALNAIAFGDNWKASTIAVHLSKIILDRDRCQHRLAELLQDENPRRPDFILKAVLDFGVHEFDIDIVEWARTKVLSRDDVAGATKADVAGCLISACYEDSRVRDLALEALRSRWGDFDSPGIGCVASAYGHDPEIRKCVLRAASTLPRNLRSIAVHQLRTCLPDDSFALDLFGQYDLEVDPEIKTEASIAYHERLKVSQPDSDHALAQLAKSIVCYGPDHDERRQAAFCGLAELDRFDVMKDARETIGDDRPCSITLYGKFSHGPNIPLVRSVLSHWARIKEVFGEAFLLRFSRNGRIPDAWNYLWDFADQHDLPRAEGLAFIESEERPKSSQAMLGFIARTRPRSNALLQYCLDTLHINDRQRDVGGALPVVAAEILGRDFSGDEEVLRRVIGNHVPPSLGNKHILALCEAWPNHRIMKEAYEAGEALQRRLNDDARIRLVCQVGTVDDVEKSINQVCASCSAPRPSYLLIAKPIIRRLSGDSQLVDRISNRLVRSKLPSEKASFFRLLARATGLSPDLRAWAMKEIESQLGKPEIGMDIVAGELSSVMHSLLADLSL
jgi:hypothetical protein